MAMLKLAAAVLAATVLSTPAAAVINAPVPTNAFITFGGNDWAWAAPCAPSSPSCGGITLAFQGALGWRLPTLAEFATGPTANDFLFRGANVPGSGTSVEGTQFFGTASDGACAAAYFSTNQNHCDFGDGQVGGIFGNGGPFTGNPNVETWVIRGAVVPEPGTWALLIVGFGMVGTAARRRRLALSA